MTSRFVRLWLPALVLAAVPALLALRFGGYHPRHAGWVALVFTIWGCVQAARGRLAMPRSICGAATYAVLGLSAWAVVSIAWATSSTHDAWVESVRFVGYAGAFVVAASVLANARTYARFASWSGIALGVLAAATLVRMTTVEFPLRAFTAGRLDWPVGYAPGLAALHVIGVFLLLGASCSAQARWLRTRATSELAISGITFALAGCCATVAALAQSRGALPAVAVALIVALIATAHRTPLLTRLLVLGGALVVIRGALSSPFSAQFNYRQAPFTPGSDADALLATATETVQHAGTVGLVLAVALGVLGAALVPLSDWIGDRFGELEERAGFGLALPAAILVVAAGATLLLIDTGDGSPAHWVKRQADACLHPKEAVNDPGSSSSYFANTGTGRCDYYRVALISAREHPLTGTGAGNFSSTYVQERRTEEQPNTAHSLPLQLLGELGIVGAALGALSLGAIVLACVRFVRSGPGRDPAFAGAVAALAYWGTHASIDWLWQLSAVTYPAVLLAGGLAACASPAQVRARSKVVAPFAAAGILIALALILPPTMADLRLRQAQDPDLRADDPTAALDKARTASEFDPSWAEPYLLQGSLLVREGKRADAARAGRDAIEAQPDDWNVQYRASGLLTLTDKAAGLRALQRAQELNPRLEAQLEEQRAAAAAAAPAT